MAYAGHAEQPARVEGQGNRKSSRSRQKQSHRGTHKENAHRKSPKAQDNRPAATGEDTNNSAGPNRTATDHNTAEGATKYLGNKFKKQI